MLQGYVGKYGVCYGHSYAIILFCIFGFSCLVKQCRCCRVAQILFSCISPVEFVGCATCFNTAALALDFSKRNFLEDVSSKHSSDVHLQYGREMKFTVSKIIEVPVTHGKIKSTSESH